MPGEVERSRDSGVRREADGMNVHDDRCRKRCMHEFVRVTRVYAEWTEICG